MSSNISLGFVQLDRTRLAVPAEFIEEVAKGPFQISDLPQSARHVIGAFSLRGMPVPVVDLEALLQPSASREKPSQLDTALVLNWNGKRIAIRIEQATEVRRVDTKALTDFEAPANQEPCLFSKVYTSKTDGQVAAVLDVEALFKSQGVRGATSLSRRLETDEERADKVGEPYVVFVAAGLRYAIHASTIVMVDTLPKEIETPLRNKVLRGYCVIRDQQLAVVNLGSMLGMPELSEDRGAQIIVLKRANEAMAVVVDSVQAIKRFSAERQEPFTDTGVAHPELFSGTVVERNEGVTLIIDHERLFNTASETGCFSQLDSANALGGSSALGSRKPAHYLVFQAGECAFATELGFLDSVSKLPDDFSSLKGPGNALAGICSRLGKTVKVFDLAEHLQRPLPPPGSLPMLLTVRSRRGLVGFLVSSIDFLKWAVPYEIPNPSKRGETHRAIRVSDNGHDVSASVLDLEALANRLCQSEQIPAPTETNRIAGLLEAEIDPLARN